MMRPELERFAGAMEGKLSKHDEERGNGWRAESIRWLLDRLRSEFRELIDAFENCDPKSVQGECVDVANFAMFIFSKLKNKDGDLTQRAERAEANFQARCRHATQAIIECIGATGPETLESAITRIITKLREAQKSYALVAVLKANCYQLRQIIYAKDEAISIMASDIDDLQGQLAEVEDLKIQAGVS